MRESERNPQIYPSAKAADQYGFSSKIRLLLIEPDREQAQVFGRWLEKEGFPVVSVSNLEEAKDKIHKNSFYMIILDIDFPEGTKQGLKVCSKLKEDGEVKDIPFILMTYRANLTTIIGSLDAGADNFILKPFETDHFLERTKFIIAEIEARKKAKRVIDLGLLHFLFALKETEDTENLLRLLCKAFNRRVWAKCVPIMRLDCVTLMVHRAKINAGEKYGFINNLDENEQGVVIKDPSGAAGTTSAETIIKGFEEFLDNFLKILRSLTGNIIVGLDEICNEEYNNVENVKGEK